MNASRLLLAAAVLGLGACSTLPPVQTAQATPGATRLVQVTPDAAKINAINDLAAHGVEPLKVYWISYPQKITVISGPSAD